ncbi:hypothetical protein [Roseateles noduli]|uniref:hypothetical protein n=1 Tax=Roseateles noduli TaxID=2052484 RepID=UPI003D64F638
MYHQPTSLRVAAGPSIASIPDVDGHAVAPVPARIKFARASSCFVDHMDIQPNQIQEWLDDSDGRPALSCTLHWLQTLLPGKGEEAAVRRGLANLDRRLTDPGQQLTGGDLYTLYGSLKRSVKQLCQGLEADQRPSTIAAACRELNPVFGVARGLGEVVEMAEATERAVSAVAEQSASPQRRCEAQAPRPVPKPRRLLPAGSTTPAVPSPSAPAAKPLPKSDDVVLTQALTDMGEEGVRACYAQLGAAFDRLISLMPPGTNPLLKSGVAKWRDSYATPADGFGREHAEMLLGGRLMLTALCNELDKLDRDRRQGVFRSLERLMPQEYVHPKARSCSYGSHVSMLANVLTDAESTSELGSPHLEERRSAFEALVAPLLTRELVTKEDVRRGMFELGLAPDWAVHGANSKMHPVYNNAAWQVCLESVLGPVEPHPLADVGKASLILALMKRYSIAKLPT